MNVCQTCGRLYGDGTTACPADGAALTAHTPELPDGATVAARWRIVRAVGVGPAGEVFEGAATAGGARVVVRLLARELTADKRGAESLRRHLLKVVGVQHPGIVPVHALEAHEDRLVLVRDWVEGERLEDLLAREGALPTVRAVTLAAGIGDALVQAHKAGLLHLQIRASNVLVVPAGAGEEARLVDFGLGPSRKVLGRPVLGDIATMAPEQIEARVPSFKSDIFSAGLLLYRMIAGTPAFGGSEQELTQRLVSAPLPPLRDPAGEMLPADLDLLVRQMTDKKPAFRPAGMAAVVERLRKIAAAGPGAATGRRASLSPAERPAAVRREPPAAAAPATHTAEVTGRPVAPVPAASAAADAAPPSPAAVEEAVPAPDQAALAAPVDDGRTTAPAPAMYGLLAREEGVEARTTAPAPATYEDFVGQAAATSADDTVDMSVDVVPAIQRADAAAPGVTPAPPSPPAPPAKPVGRPKPPAPPRAPARAPAQRGGPARPAATGEVHPSPAAREPPAESPVGRALRMGPDEPVVAPVKKAPEPAPAKVEPKPPEKAGPKSPEKAEPKPPEKAGPKPPEKAGPKPPEKAAAAPPGAAAPQRRGAGRTIVQPFGAVAGSAGQHPPVAPASPIKPAEPAPGADRAKPPAAAAASPTGFEPLVPGSATAEAEPPSPPGSGPRGDAEPAEPAAGAVPAVSPPSPAIEPESFSFEPPAPAAAKSRMKLYLAIGGGVALVAVVLFLVLRGGGKGGGTTPGAGARADAGMDDAVALAAEGEDAATSTALGPPDAAEASPAPQATADTGDTTDDAASTADADAGTGMPDADAGDGGAPEVEEPEAEAAAPADADAQAAEDAGADRAAAEAAAGGASADSLVASGNRALASRDFGRAEGLFRQALALDPGNRQARIGLGKAAFQQGDFAEAVRRFEPIYRTRGNMDLGVAYVRVGRREDAKRQFQLILERDPNDDAARRALDALNR
ncbi:MAG: protein kinase [Deltaproteobacteria bacterium]|nr:protein kinase [Deltaproteobacteria bacterium]